MLITVLTILASGIGFWAVFKNIILIELRIDSNTFKTLYEICKNDKKIILTEEFTSSIDSKKYPIVYVAFCIFKNSPWFYINHSERLMQAGWQNKDYVTSIYCFRFQVKEIKNFLNKKMEESQLELGIPVRIIDSYGYDRIGSLKEITPEPVVDEFLWKDFELEVAEVVNNTRKRTSAIFYGPPGNGKTSVVKYLATKYRLPIMILTFNPDWTNHDLLLVFSKIPNKCIVLLEDFDNYFDNRKCIIGTDNKSIKFTFDIILNGLDGVYTTYENVVFIMTVNDINKVDYALKNRPSRFKFNREFDNPSLKIRSKLLPLQWSEKSEGLNLDQVFRLKEYFENGLDMNSAFSMLKKKISKKNGKKS